MRRSARFVTVDRPLREVIEEAMANMGLGPTMLPVSPKTYYRVMDGGSVNIGPLARLLLSLEIDQATVVKLGYPGVAAEMRRSPGTYSEGLLRSMQPKR